MAKRVIPHGDVVAIQAFLRYLQGHYNKLVNPNDTYLIAAVASWVYQESGSLSRVIGNNPFNIRDSPLESGTRSARYIVNGRLKGNGHFAIFSSLAVGFEAAAYLLIHGNKAYGYQLALAALTHGGNQAAVDFLAAIARSSWDAGHYGTSDWLSAYDPTKNHLLRVYLGITGVQLADPHPHQPKAATPKKPPTLPVQYRYIPLPNPFLDPYAAKTRYDRRHGQMGARVAGTGLKR